MKVIRFRYRDQAEAIHRILDLARSRGDKVEREAEEVLTMWVTADGDVLCIAPPPRRISYAGVEVGDSGAESYQVTEDLWELLGEHLGRSEQAHGVE